LPLIAAGEAVDDGAGPGGGEGFGDLKLKLTVTQPPLVPWTEEQRTALKSVFMPQKQ
jgi:hypothetical protein